VIILLGWPASMMLSFHYVKGMIQLVCAESVIKPQSIISTCQ